MTTQSIVRHHTFATSTMVLGIGLATLAGCILGEPDEVAATEDAVQTSTWQAVVRCQNNALIIDVNTNARRSLQAVIRDPAAVAYLAAHPGGAGTPIVNSRGEIILRGESTSPVFDRASFVRLVRKTYAVRDARLPEAYAEVDGTGVKIRLVTWASGAEVETANWYFPHCH